MKAAIIGGAGYTGGELTRLLINHPGVEIGFIHSESNAGRPVAEVHEGLYGDTDLVFADAIDFEGIDVLFICSGHGFSRRFLDEHTLPEGMRVIDLAQDFRDESDGFVYGLPELNRPRIATATRVANPGCFATAIQLSLLPLAAKGLLGSDVNITGITGSTGAGVKPGASTHFSWRSDNLSVYKAFEHQHMAEVGRTLASLQGAGLPPVNFLPMRGDFARGIFAVSHMLTPLSLDDIYDIYTDRYRDEPFTHVVARPVDLKQAVNTNKAVMSLEKHGDRLLVTCAIDNLLKGASGQAVQNLNIMAGFPEDTGLRLKPSAF